MAESRLPSLPPSDEVSLAKNVYNGYYKVKASDFWGENEIIRIEDKPFKKCDHEFKAISNGVECIKCYFGLQGIILVEKGKLYFKGKKLPL